MKIASINIQKDTLAVFFFAALIYSFIGKPSYIFNDHSRAKEEQLVQKYLQNPLLLKKRIKNELEKNPENMMSRRLLAQISLRLGDYEESAKQFAILLKTQYKDEFIKGFVMSLNKMKHILSTSEWDLVKTYEKKHQDDWEIHAILGEAYNNENNTHQAYQQFIQSKKLSSQDSEQIPWLNQQINLLKFKTKPN